MQLDYFSWTACCLLKLPKASTLDTNYWRGQEEKATQITPVIDDQEKVLADDYDDAIHVGHKLNKLEQHQTRVVLDKIVATTV